MLELLRVMKDAKISEKDVVVFAEAKGSSLSSGRRATEVTCHDPGPLDWASFEWMPSSPAENADPCQSELVPYLRPGSKATDTMIKYYLYLAIMLNPALP